MTRHVVNCVAISIMLMHNTFVNAADTEPGQTQWCSTHVQVKLLWIKVWEKEQQVLCADAEPAEIASAADEDNGLTIQAESPQLQTRTTAVIAAIDTDCDAESYLFGAVKWCSHNPYEDTPHSDEESD